MNAIPEWRLVGDWFDICSCNIPCPCEFAQAPTNNACQGVLAWHIREGHYGAVRLDGLNLLGLGAFEGNVWAGGWPATFATLIGEFRGIEFVPITFELADELAFWSAEIPGRVVARAEALSGPTTPPGQRIQTLNPPGSEVGPGQTATWGRSVEVRMEGFGFRWTGESRSSKHIPFDWTGPGAT